MEAVVLPFGSYYCLFWPATGSSSQISMLLPRLAAVPRVPQYQQYWCEDDHKEEEEEGAHDRTR